MRPFLLHWGIVVAGAIFLFIHIFFFLLKNTGKCLWVLSVPHSVGIYAKNADERGRKFMCERTLLSVLDGCYWIKFYIINCNCSDFSNYFWLKKLFQFPKKVNAEVLFLGTEIQYRLTRIHRFVSRFEKFGTLNTTDVNNMKNFTFEFDDSHLVNYIHVLDMKKDKSLLLYSCRATQLTSHAFTQEHAWLLFRWPDVNLRDIREAESNRSRTREWGQELYGKLGLKTANPKLKFVILVWFCVEVLRQVNLLVYNKLHLEEGHNFCSYTLWSHLEYEFNHYNNLRRF